MDDVKIDAEALINRFKVNFAKKVAEYESQVAVLQVQNEQLRNENSQLKEKNKGAK
ncbi:hypothetical protein [Lactiplantibacillus paraxiangfangensis]|uniref:hypothetical protein n=1 Tax=Lactiplantibacillus paraxiangfangensis TaxID=3076224 RepID=UPI0030C76E8F